MPVAKYLSYARSRSRTERLRRIDGPSFTYPRPLSQQASSARSAIRTASVAPRSVFRTIAQFTNSAGDIILAIASWMLMQIPAGCLTYAIAMYGIPEAAFRGEPGEPEPAPPPDPLGNAYRPIPHVIISLDTEGEVRAGETFPLPDVAQIWASTKSAARSGQTFGARSGWRTLIIAPAFLLLSKIREASARRRAIAELQNLDDRSLKDIGISRADILYIATHGARPE